MSSSTPGESRANTRTPVAVLTCAAALAGTWIAFRADMHEAPDHPAVVAPPLYDEEYIAGHSVEQRPIPCVVLGEGDDVVLILASIHGNENRGTPLLHRLAELLRQQPELLKGRRVVLMPTANPDGVAAGIRFNVRGVDLNRNFEAENRQNSKRFGMSALSEPEALAIFRVIEQHRPHRIVSLHEPLNCIDYDGPAGELAQHMGRYCPLPVKRLGSRPGSLGSYAGLELGVPIITFEMPREARDQPDDQLWQLYGSALLAAVTWPEPLPESLPGEVAAR